MTQLLGILTGAMIQDQLRYHHQLNGSAENLEARRILPLVSERFRE